jgi:uncharacterized membrane protein YkoI
MMRCKGIRPKRNRLFTVALASLPIWAGVAVAGDDDIGHEAARRLLESGRILPLETILADLAERVPGKLIETKLEYDDGVILYDLKILRPEGRVQEVEVDAATGRILKIEDDD